MRFVLFCPERVLKRKTLSEIKSAEKMNHKLLFFSFYEIQPSFLMGEYKVLSNKDNGVPCDRMVRDSIFSLGKDNELNLLILGTLNC